MFAKFWRARSQILEAEKNLREAQRGLLVGDRPDALRLERDLLAVELGPSGGLLDGASLLHREQPDPPHLLLPQASSVLSWQGSSVLPSRQRTSAVGPPWAPWASTASAPRPVLYIILRLIRI